MVNQLFATPDKGVTHIALGGIYLGKVNSYNHWYTRFFAFIGQIFGMSELVTINKKIHYFEKKSYHEFLSSHGIEPSLVTSDLDQLKDIIKQPEIMGAMRDHLSLETSHKLFRKLIKAEMAGDFEKAQKYAGKGASLDDYFWVRNTEGLKDQLAEHIDSSLKRDQSYVYTAKKYTPLLYAAEKENTELCEWLKACGASTSLKGERVRFQRKTTSVYYTDNTFAYFQNKDTITHELISIFHGIVDALEWRVGSQKKETFSPLPYA